MQVIPGARRDHRSFTPIHILRDLGLWFAALSDVPAQQRMMDNRSYIADASVPRGVWNPWKATGTYKTAGWETVSYPLSEFNYSFDGSVSANKLTADMMRGLTFYVWHGGVAGKDCNPHICIDNIRVVPK